MKSKDLRKKLLEKSATFRKEYLKSHITLEISHMIVRERINQGLTQEALAKLVGTKQSGIARTERGNTFPKIELLERIAEALRMQLFIEFRNVNTYTSSQSSSISSVLHATQSPFFGTVGNIIKSSISTDSSNVTQQTSELIK